MEEIDADASGQIDRQEWRDKWLLMQKTLGNSPQFQTFNEFFNPAKFKATDDLQLIKQENFGQNGTKVIPLYAFGNKMSFYRLPCYPEEDRPQGGSMDRWTPQSIFICNPSLFVF